MIFKGSSLHMVMPDLNCDDSPALDQPTKGSISESVARIDLYNAVALNNPLGYGS